MIRWCGLILGCGLIFSAIGDEWVASYRTARTKAVQQHKKLLIFFSGSDWCEEGRMLSRDLFKTEAFQKVASKKYILYNADFPKYTRLGQETEDRNRSLSTRYGVHRFPAVVLVEPSGGGLLVKQIGMRGMTVRELLKKLEAAESETAHAPSDASKSASNGKRP